MSMLTKGQVRELEKQLAKKTCGMKQLRQAIRVHIAATECSLEYLKRVLTESEESGVDDPLHADSKPSRV